MNKKRIRSLLPWLIVGILAFQLFHTNLELDDIKASILQLNEESTGTESIQSEINLAPLIEPSTVSNSNNNKSDSSFKVTYLNDDSGTSTYSPGIANEYIVYITKTGEKYHRDGCQYLRKSQIEITLSEAKSLGYTPCSVCKP